MQKIFNPYSGELIGEEQFTSCDELFVQAKNACSYHQRQVLSTSERIFLVEKLAQLFESNKVCFAELITQETGKTITDAKLEVSRSINLIKHFIFEMQTLKGELLLNHGQGFSSQKWGLIERIPIGCILCITPFNFPLILTLHKIIPAFLMGNSVLLKPGPSNILVTKKLMTIIEQAGFPLDAIQMIYPEIPDLTQLISSDKIDAISLTGGISTARAIAKNSGMKKLLLELGGNDVMIIFPDANLEQACDNLINGRFGGAGQKCNAPKKVFIHQDVYDQFKNLLLEKSSKLIYGDPALPETFLGPVISLASSDLIQNRIDQAIHSGAKLLLGGKKIKNLCLPTILENVDHQLPLVKDETFGPVISLFNFTETKKLIAICNESEFGLQAGIYTQNINTIKYFFKKLQVATVIANDGPNFRIDHFPFGGIKNSGNTREGGKFSLEEYSQIKTLIW